MRGIGALLSPNCQIFTKQKQLLFLFWVNFKMELSGSCQVTPDFHKIVVRTQLFRHFQHYKPNF